jgi:hypothetical protein
MPTWTLLLIAQASPVPLSAPPTFLTGCWEERKSDRWTEECWTAPRDGLMLGSGRSGQGGAILDWEWMRIERSVDGTLSFFASPKGAPPVAFKSAKVSDTEVEFVNSAHDYPQRIRYVRTTTGIDAETSLIDGDRLVHWSYRRSGSSTGQ